MYLFYRYLKLYQFLENSHLLNSMSVQTEQLKPEVIKYSE
jgi:hypothetical protein